MPTETQKRVWGPLDVGGLRLYEVHLVFPNHPEWRKHHIVAAHTPRHAAQLLQEMHKESKWIEEPIFIGYPLNVYMPDGWTEEIPDSPDHPGWER